MPPVGLKRKAEDSLSDDSSDDAEDTKQIIEIESEEEMDWDICTKVVKVPSKKDKIIGYHLMPTCLPEPKIKEEQPQLNKAVKTRLLQDFKDYWSNNKSFDTEHFEIIAQPWKVCIIKELLEDVNILKNVRQEFYELDWNKRKLDLYQLYQSDDLKNVDSKDIKLMYNFLKNDVMPLVGDLMNVELTHISATCSYYTDTDYLLVHDDQRDDRVVAFVLYISDVYEWQNSWGGSLQLLSHDDNFQPNCVERSVYPRNNQLVLFPVSPISYHQVDEITNKNFCRYSINGWFHGKVISSDIIPICLPIQTATITDAIISDIDLNEYINPIYLDQENVMDIHEQIEACSEISLLSYFKEEFIDKINEALADSELRWRFVGPPNRCHYEVLDECNKPGTLVKLLELFRSEVMFTLFKCYTELELQPVMRYEIQRWSASCYSLLHDTDVVSEPELDIVLHIGCKNVVGGNIQYIDENEEIQTALVTLEHTNNTLNVIYRDSAMINHYVSKYTRDPFYVLICSYGENIRK